MVKRNYIFLEIELMQVRQWLENKLFLSCKIRQLVWDSTRPGFVLKVSADYAFKYNFVWNRIG